MHDTGRLNIFKQLASLGTRVDNTDTWSILTNLSTHRVPEEDIHHMWVCAELIGNQSDRKPTTRIDQLIRIIINEAHDLMHNPLHIAIPETLDSEGVVLTLVRHSAQTTSLQITPLSSIPMEPVLFWI